MPSYDLLYLNSIYFPKNRILDFNNFFKIANEIFDQIIADTSQKSKESIIQRQEQVRLYIRYYRTAIITFVCCNDYHNIKYLVSLYNIDSQKVLIAGKGLALQEFSILEVHKETQEELDNEIEAIRELQLTITQPAVNILEFPTNKKFAKAANHQGLDNLSPIYRKHYKPWHEHILKQKDPDG